MIKLIKYISCVLACTLCLAAPVFSADLTQVGSIYKTEIGVRPGAKAKFQIGAVDKFIPTVRMSWELSSGLEKEWMRVTRRSVVVDKELPSSLSDTLSLKVGDQTDIFEPKDDETFLWDVLYDKDPNPGKPHVEIWDIQHSGLNFYYQPALTQDEIDEGCFRPENVVGSYAVYGGHVNHVSRAGKTLYNGGTGKRLHIYTPQLIDSKGTERWAEL